MSCGSSPKLHRISRLRADRRDSGSTIVLLSSPLRDVLGRYPGGVCDQALARCAQIVSLLLSLVACRSSEPAAATRSDEPNARPATDSASSRDDRSGVTASPDPTRSAPAASDDPDHAAKLADLDALCAAVDRDYVDGTLSDYYAKVEPKTEWGREQKRAGNESITPGHLLEKAVAELSPGGTGPELESCRKLLDYLDEVE